MGDVAAEGALVAVGEGDCTRGGAPANRQRAGWARMSRWRRTVTPLGTSLGMELPGRVMAEKLDGALKDAGL